MFPAPQIEYNEEEGMLPKEAENLHDISFYIQKLAIDLQ